MGLGIKRRIASFFARNIAKKSFIYDMPGLLYSKFNVENQKIFLRHLFLYEDFLASLEVETRKKFGKDGSKALYTAGKIYGKNFATMTEMPNYKSSMRDFKASVLIQYLATMYATQIKHKINWDSKKIELEVEDYVICRKSGQGELLSTGGAAGIWVKFCDDEFIEGVQDFCEGRGDDRCKIVCAPNIGDFSITELPLFEYTDLYRTVNSFEKKLDTFSLDKYLDHYYCTYKGGHLLIRDERFVPFDCSLVYMYEHEINKKFGDEGIYLIRDTAFKEYKKLANILLSIYNQNKFSISDAFDYINKFLGAFGFGQLREYLGTKEFYVIKFPFFELKTKFPTYEGIISGLLSGLTKEEKNIRVKKEDLSSSCYTLILGAE